MLMVEWYVYALAAMLVFSFANLALKELMRYETKPLFEQNKGALYSVALVLLVALIVLYATHLRFLHLPKGFTELGLVFLVLVVVGFVFLLLALEHGKIGPVTAVLSASAAVVAVLSVFFLKDVLSAKEWAGIVLVSLGVLLLVR